MLPIFRDVGLAPRSQRNKEIDGLRGYLALAVVLEHSVIYDGFLRTGEWLAPPTVIYPMGAVIGVSCFFMITAYLFWGKVIRAAGQLDFPALLVQRLFRLGPVYLVVVAAGTVIAIWDGKGAGIDLGALIGNLFVGVIPYRSPTATAVGQVALAGVTWTLAYEWLFYAALPLISFARRIKAPPMAFPSILCLGFGGWAAFTSNPLPALLLLFAAGMLIAEAVERDLRMPGGRWVTSAVFAGCMAALLSAPSIESYSVPGVMLTGIMFYAVASGADLFGLLRSEPAVRLGEISYGIYLAQGPVLMAFFLAPGFRSFALQSPIGHWTVAGSAIAVLIILALLVHYFVERPLYLRGKAIVGR